MNAHIDRDLVYGLVAYVLLLKRSPKLTVEKRIGFMCLCCFCTYQCSEAEKKLTLLTYILWFCIASA